MPALTFDDLSDADPIGMVQDVDFVNDLRHSERSPENAVSPKGARSSMQVMPGTAKDPGFGVKPAQDDSTQEFDRVGNDYGQALLKHYNNRVVAAAAYNAGPGAVDKWLKDFGDPRTGAISEADWAAKIPYEETRNYASPYAAPQQSGAIRFDDLAPGTSQHGGALTFDDVAAAAPLPKSSAAGSFGRGAVRGALPAGGGMAGFGLGAEAGATLGAPIAAVTGPFAPVVETILTLGSGVAGAYYGADVVGKAQDWMLKHMPDAVAKTLGQDPAQQAADVKKHPYASFAGELAPNLALLRPTMAVKELPEVLAPGEQPATATARLLSHPLTARAVGAGSNAALEAGQEEANTGTIDPRKVAIAAGVGALSNKETGLGSALSRAGAAPVRSLAEMFRAGRAAPGAAPHAGQPPEGDTFEGTYTADEGPQGPQGGAPTGRAAIPPATPPKGQPGAPAPGEDIGLKFPDGKARRATVDGYSSDGQTVRVQFEDGSTSEHLTSEILRDRVEPPPLAHEDAGDHPRGPQLSQEERSGPPLEESGPEPISARNAARVARRAPQPQLDPQALHALDLAQRLEANAMNATVPMSTADRIAALQQVARIRAQYAPEGEESRPNQYRHPAASEPSADIGQLGIARAQATNPDLYDVERFPGDVRNNVSRETDQGPTPPTKRPPDLVQFLGGKGGIQANDPYASGNLQAMDAHRKFIPGTGMLVRQKGGMSLDQAREQAAEAGYGGNYNNFETVDDLMDALRDNLAGTDVFSTHDGPEAAAWAAHQAMRRLPPEDENQQVNATIDDLRDKAEHLGIQHDESWSAEDLMAAVTEHEAIRAERNEGHDPQTFADARELDMDYVLSSRWPETFGQFKDEGVAEENPYQEAAARESAAEPAEASDSGSRGEEAGPEPGGEEGAARPGGNAGDIGAGTAPRATEPAARVEDIGGANVHLIAGDGKGYSVKQVGRDRYELDAGGMISILNGDSLKSVFDSENMVVGGNGPIIKRQPIRKHGDETPAESGALAARRMAEENVNTNPSQAQIAAGNYKHGHVDFQGLKVSIETPSGAERRGSGPGGKKWAVKLDHPYGYVKGSKGADGEHVDVYMGPHHDSPDVFVVDQIHPDTKAFDEHKAILGARTEEEAREIYDAGFSDNSGPARTGAITAMSVDHFREWLDEGHQTEPLAHVDESATKVAELPTKADLTARADDLGLKLPGDATRAEMAGTVDLREANLTPDADAAPARDTIEARIDAEAAQSLPEVFDEEGWSPAGAEETAGEPPAHGGAAAPIEQHEGAAAEAPDREGAAAEPAGGGHPGGEGAARGLEGAEVRQNADHNGVEVRFPGKPSAETIGRLKAAGFRWSRPQKLWYAKRSERTLAAANALAAPREFTTTPGAIATEHAAEVSRLEAEATAALAKAKTPTARAAAQGAAQGARAEMDAGEYQPAAMPITAAAPPPKKPPVADLFSRGDEVAPRPDIAQTLPPREGSRFVTDVSDDGGQVTLDGGAVLPAGEVEPISGHGLQKPVRPAAAGERPEAVHGPAAPERAGRLPAGKEPGGAPAAGRPAGERAEGAGRAAEGHTGIPARRGAGEGPDVRLPRAGEGPESGAAGRPDRAVKGENFSIEPGEVAEGRGPKAKAADNLSAIRLAKRLIAEDRPATREEQAALAKYVGWGGLSGAFEGSDGKFGTGFEDIGRDLKELLTPDEYRTAARSTQYAHYTAENVIRAMWDAVGAMGFKGGSVFEPGMGVGHFLGMMPPDTAAASHYQGIELDHLTADIAKLLYPRSGVRQADFTETPLPDNTFDLVIGNPPFSDTVIKADPKYAARGFMLHDYFFAKSLDAVRPGGLLAFVTSAGTMNKMDPAARNYLGERASFLGGVRLPSNAFKKNAGTEVTTDILFFQKRPDNLTPTEFRAAPEAAWTSTVSRDLPDNEGNLGPVHVSRYFSEHPEQVLGREGRFDKLYQGRYAVHAPEGVDLTSNLQAALSRLPRDVYTAAETPREKAAMDFSGKEKKDGSFYMQDGRLMQYSDGVGRPVARRGAGVEGGVTGPAHERIIGLIPIRDALRDVFAHDLADKPAEAAKAREALNRAYDAFLRKFGPINKAEFQYRRPNVVQQEGARAEARELARDRGEAWNEGAFNAEPYRRAGQSMGEIARARAAARAEAGAGFDEGSFNPAEMPDIVLDKRPNIEPFMDDPESYRMRAIENYNDTNREHSKKRVFFESVLTREQEPTLKSANDGVLWSLNKFGRLDLDGIAQKMGRDRGEIIAELGNAIFKVPHTDDTYQTSDEYLAGDIPNKIAEAKAAAQHDPDVRRNVEALEAAMPAPLAPSEISMNLGMPWVPANYVEEFARDHLKIGEARIRHSPALGGWTVSPISTGPDVAMWGTDARGPMEILTSALNRTPPRIYKEYYVPGEGKKREFDPIATQAAQDKYEAVRNAFNDWVSGNQDRAEKLATVYNNALNRTVLRKFDGSYLTTPGVASDWSWRPHQQRVVARIIQAGNTYVAHAVGAGKTSEMIGAGMEMRRLGLVKKPMYVVPNHMLAQFTKEFYEQYPTARIAVADERRFHTDRRKQFVANVAQDDLDAVIITHSAFGKIPISGGFQRQLIEEELDHLSEALQGLDKQNDRITIKRLENQKEKLEQQLKGATSAHKDATNTFEEMGPDFLFVDEAHNFRKLNFATRQSGLKGIDPDGSQAAFDLYAKIRYLESKKPGRSAVLASGTPVTNTMGELYTISRYLQRQELQDRGIDHFDSWSSTFGDTKTELEQTPSGSYAPVTRFARFVNIPELYKMVGSIMDIVTPHQLDQYVVRPKLKGGKRNFNLAPQSDLLANYQASLGRRMEAIKARKGPPKPGDDIMLSVINDGRHAAIDMRFVDPFAPNDPDSKLNQMIDNVHRIWKATKDTQFKDPRSNYEKNGPRGSATQMIFANLGIGSGGEKFSGYDWIKRELIRRGINPGEIAFIRDFKSHVARQKLFNDMNEGKVRILVGSTQKMGTGVNAQKRLYAIHNQDPLWYPADDEQRVGRGLRQGNMNPEIEIHDYSVKGTYDSVMWQMMGRKARFIEQFFRGDPELRDMEDLGEASQYEQASAISTSDPRIMQLTDLRQQLDRARRRESAHEREQYSMRSRLQEAQSSIASVDKGIPTIEGDIARRQDVAGDKFAMKVGRKTYTDRTEAADAMRDAYAAEWPLLERDKDFKLGEIGGFDVHVAKEGLLREKPVFYMKRSDGNYSDIGASTPAGVIRSMENRLPKFEDEIKYLERRRAEAEASVASLRSQIGKPFTGGEEITRLKQEVKDLEAALAPKKEEPKAPPAVMAQAEAAVEPLSEKQFYSQYAQHIDLRGRQSGNALQTREAILRDGFKKGSNVNALPPYRGGEPTNFSEAAARPQAGDVVYLVPRHAWKDRPNGMEVQNGWKPEPYEVVVITDPSKSMYENYREAFGKSQHPEIHAQAERDAAPFYSALTRNVDALPQNRATAAQWSNIIDNLKQKGVKQDEIDWSGIKTWLADEKLLHGDKPVDKKRVVDFLRNNEIQIQEVQKGAHAEGSAQLAEVQHPQMMARYREFDRLGVARLSPEELSLMNWMDANPDASDTAYLTREYDAWLNDHRHLPRMSADELLGELADIRLSGRRSGDEIDSEINWLRNFSERWEEAENGERHATGEGSPTRYGSYALPGGKNYRELLLTLPENASPNKGPKGWGDTAGGTYDPENFRSGHWDEPNILAHVRFDDRTGPNGEKILHVAEVQSDWHQQGRRRGYRSPERLADIERLKNERADLLPQINELLKQHDFMGFDTRDEARSAIANEPESWEYDTPDDKALAIKFSETVKSLRNADVAEGVPNAPFKTTWQELAVKRMLRYAAEHGYDKLSWDTGDTNADRYDLSKTISNVSLQDNASGGVGRASLEGPFEHGQLRAYDHDNRQVISKHINSEDELVDAIGKDAAEKLLNAAPSNKESAGTGVRHREVSGLDLKVGGEGMRGFYDKILPTFLNKYAKKWGAKVEKTTINNAPTGEYDQVAYGYEKGGIAVHSIAITPAMRESVMAGQPLFQRGEGPSPVSGGETKYLVADLIAHLPKTPTRTEAQMIEQVNKIMRQIVPTAEVIPAARLTHEGKNILGATFVDGPRWVIAWSFRSPDAVATGRHEAVHYLRNVGFFTPREWDVLSKAAIDNGWISHHGIVKRYPGLDPAQHIEEAVAEEFSKWERNEAMPEQPVRRLFARMRDLLGRVRRYFKSLLGEKVTAEDIFHDIMSGEIGNRQPTGNRVPDAEVFAQAAKTPDGPPETPQDGRDYIDETARDIAEHLQEKGPGTYERTLQRLSPPSGPELFHDPNGLQQLFMGPRIVAEMDTKSGRLWTHIKAMDDEGHQRLNDLRDRIEKTFLKMPREAQDRVNAVMELDRLGNVTRTDDGRSIVARNEKFPDAQGSKPGDRIILDPKESKAYFELQNMYRRAWDSIMEGAARRMGWMRRWSPAMADNLRLIASAMETADHPRNRKAFARLHDVMQAMDEQRRAAYMPLMRFGDYYISVKPKEAPGIDSTGGFLKTVWFEMVEKPAFQYADVNPVNVIRGRITKTGEVPEHAKARLAELQKKYPPSQYRVESGYLFSKPDALRTLSIPAVEKLLMLMEGGVMERLKTEASMGGFANKAAAREDATKRYQDLYSELVDAVQDEMYENLKAGFKKKSATVPGYSGDWNRVLGSYMNWTSRHVARQIHGDDVERTYDDIQVSHPHKAMKDFWRNWKQADENPLSPLSRAAMGANQLGFLYTLAFSPASTVSVMMHGPTYAIPVLSTGLGAGKAGAAFSRAYGEATAAMRANVQAGGLHVDVNKVGKTPDERAFLRQMERDGDLHAKGADDVRSMGEKSSALWGDYSPHAKKIMDVVSSNIAAADQANRVAAALAGYRLARDGNLGQMNTVWTANQVWRAIAQKDGVSPETMGKFLMTQAVGEWGAKSRSRFGRTVVGRMGSALHGFQVRFMSNLIKQGLNQGLPGRVAMAWTLAGLWAAAGLQGLPFFIDAENALDVLWKALSKHHHDLMTPWRVRALLADTGLGKMGAEIALRGPLSVLTGWDFSSRLGFGDVITKEVAPWFGGDESAFTFPSIIAGIGEGVAKRMDSRQPAAAAASVLPAGLRHPAMAAIDAEHGIKSQTGKTTYVPARKVTVGDTVGEALGFTPLDVTRARERQQYGIRKSKAHGPVPHDYTP